MMTILVGTDFGEGSHKAFRQACRLAQGQGARVHLLHVIEPVDEPGSVDAETQQFYRQLTEAAEQKFDALLQSEPPMSEVSREVRVGPRITTLLQVAESLQAELTILGSVPVSEENQRLGVSHRVALTSTRPVLLVP